jgi:hypothetical protein
MSTAGFAIDIRNIYKIPVRMNSELHLAFLILELNAIGR